MGIFDHFKKQNTAPAAPSAPAADRMSFGAGVMEIARLISFEDGEVLKDISACTKDPAAWFEAHQEQYEERSVMSADDLELVQWLGLVDILEEHGWVCERDWKDELEDLTYFIQDLRGFQRLGLEMDLGWFDEDGDIPAWCGVLTEKWAAQGARMAAIGIDSDSYVLFPAAPAQFVQLQKLAGDIGQSIDYVE